MLNRFKFTAMVLSVGLLGACASEPMSVGHDYKTSDGFHWAVQISMHTGVPNTPIQTLMVLYNKTQRTPIATISGQTKPLGEKLAEDLLHLVSRVGAAAITGQYILKAAKAECPPEALCGTLVQVSNQAGANADSSSSASQQGAASNTGGS